MAQKEVYTFPSKDGESTLHAVRWTPDDGQVKATLMITHGMVEYVERYTPFAEWLTTKGFAVFGHDHIGHGDSVKSPEQWGIMHAEHPSDIMVEDMLTDYQVGRKLWPDVPHFMLGHSMGSYMLRKFIAEKADDIQDLKGAIIMGTGTVPESTCNLAITLMKIIAKFHGWDYRSQMIAGMMFGKPYKKYNLDGTQPENSWLSKNVENVKKYYKDPKCTFTFSLGAYRGLVESVLYDGKPENAAKVPKDLPLILVSGQDDPVGDFGEGVKTAYQLYQDAGIKDVQMKLYPNDRHEILNEPDHEMIFNDLLNWMTSHA